MSADEQASAPLGQLLLELQDVDSHADQLSYRLAHLPSRRALDEIAARRAALTRDLARIASDRSGLEARAAELEHEVTECDERLGGLERRLTSGQVGSYRDEEAIAGELASVARRKDELEDAQLELMEALEPFEKAAAAIAVEEAGLEDERRTRLVELAADEAAIEAERATVTAQRARAVAVVPQARQAEYDKLRTRFAGVAVARLVHGTCSGCNLALSSSELDRVRHLPEGALAHCEQCGRILVP